MAHAIERVGLFLMLCATCVYWGSHFFFTNFQVYSRRTFELLRKSARRPAFHY